MTTPAESTATFFRWSEIHLPSHLPHSAIALEDSRVLDVFSPPREDWVNGTDDYLRR